jgi:deoxyribose-phosphate aldolase
MKILTEKVNNEINIIRKEIANNDDFDMLKKLFNLIDLTSLNSSDNNEKITELTKKVSNFDEHFPKLLNVAAICVYPNFIETVKTNLKCDSVKIASVGGSFPSSQTFLAVKTAECDLCAKKGADEIDIVLPIGKFLSERYDDVVKEISLIKSTIGDTKLKVILETGELKNLNNIYDASILSMQAGADFIKTSTGKTPVSATPEAVYTMCLAIKEYHTNTGKKVGIKPSGGIAEKNDAIFYYLIIKKVLGKEWLNNKQFRLGASRLANNLLNEMYSICKNTNEKINYF